MDKERVQRLRRKQRIGLNLFYLVISGFVIGLILFLNATRGDIYELLGVSFLAVVVGQWLNKTSSILSLSNMKELDAWEREKLGENWFKYYFPGILLRIILAIYFFMQAGLYSGKTPFRSEIPLWYLIVIPLILIFIGNRSNIKQLLIQLIRSFQNIFKYVILRKS